MQVRICTLSFLSQIWQYLQSLKQCVKENFSQKFNKMHACPGHIAYEWFEGRSPKQGWPSGYPAFSDLLGREYTVNTTVNKLLDVDREARQMLDEAQQYYDRTLREIETEKEAMRADFTRKARQHLEELETAQAQELEETAGAVRSRAAGLRAAMEARYEQNHAQWEEELYRKTIY